MSLSPARLSTETPPIGLAASAETLRSSLRPISPAHLASRTDTRYQEHNPGQGEFSLSFFTDPIRLTFPALIAQRQPGDPLPLPVQALLLYYFSASDGSPLSGKWVSFGDLPGGRIYQRAFQGYSGDKLSRLFGNHIDQFCTACLAAGAQPAEGGDVAFLFQALPRLPICVTYWQGDDEFPPTCQLLFDRSACSHLPIDVCAILGSMLVSRISKAAALLQSKGIPA